MKKIIIIATAVFILCIPIQMHAASSTANISTNFPWAWTVTRAAGIASYILLALMTVIGISLSTGLLFRLFQPATAWSIHRAIGSALLVSVILHVFSQLFDHFIGMRLVDLLVPFASRYQMTLVALGVFSFYVLLLLLWSSLYTMTNRPRFWRLVHYLSFPMFALIFLHGILIGTERHLWWMQTIYWSSAAIIGVMIYYRVWWRFHKQTE